MRTTDLTRWIVGALVAAAWTQAVWSAEPTKARVMIIGDSISQGYCRTVQEELKDVAVVVHSGHAGGTGGKMSKPSLPKATGESATNAPVAYETVIDLYLANGPFDLVHFNFGLHDLTEGGIPTKQYISNLDQIVERLRKSGAKLVFATTTPVPPKNRHNRKPERVVEINEAAVKLMKEKGVAVDDLYSAMLPHQAELQGKDDVHFTDAGNVFLGKQVAKAIREALGSKPDGGTEKKGTQAQ